jgi:hypothetical protein
LTPGTHPTNADRELRFALAHSDSARNLVELSLSNVAYVVIEINLKKRVYINIMLIYLTDYKIILVYENVYISLL